MGAAAAGIYKTVTGMREAGKSAQELSTSAQNAGLSVENSLKYLVQCRY
jgi:hypothetical protein